MYIFKLYYKCVLLTRQIQQNNKHKKMVYIKKYYSTCFLFIVSEHLSEFWSLCDQLVNTSLTIVRIIRYLHTVNTQKNEIYISYFL